MSETQWYYMRSGQSVGPVSQTSLRGMIATGELKPGEMVRNESMPDWQPVSSLPVLQSAALSTPIAATTVLPYSSPVYAGFWLRVVAYLIDGIVLIIPCIILWITIIGPGIAVWLYYSIMESRGTQATLGKMALGLKVTDLKGQRLSFGRATGRFFGKIISGMVLYIGFLMAAWTEKKQCLHDMMAKTLVVRKV